MCKFSNHLFAFTFVLIVICIHAVPLFSPEHRSIYGDDGGDVDSSFELFDLKSILKLVEAYNDYDLHYDQRQNGKANLRKRLDGFLIIAPTDLFGDQEIPDPSNFGFLDEFLSDDGRNMQKPNADTNSIQQPTSKPIDLIKSQAADEPTSKKSLDTLIDASGGYQHLKSNGHRRFNINNLFNVVKTFIRE